MSLDTYFVDPEGTPLSYTMTSSPSTLGGGDVQLYFATVPFSST
jgi:hypothetical protein